MMRPTASAVDLITVPYDSGRRDFRMGRGPGHLLHSGLATRLQALGHRVQVVTLESAGSAMTSMFDLAAQVAAAVATAQRNGRFPIILAGNCSASLGGFAGLASRTAVLWLDAHADLNTPDTSPSGFLDGMALAVMTGRCYLDNCRGIPGFEPLRDADLILLGTREVDPGEQPVVQQLRIAHNANELAAALAAISRDELYVHLDLDVLDPSALRANEFATMSGLPRETLYSCIAAAAASKRIAALAITAYDPQADAADRGPAIVTEVIGIVLGT